MRYHSISGILTSYYVWHIQVDNDHDIPDLVLKCLGSYYYYYFLFFYWICNV